MDLKGRVLFITGGSRGIGLEIGKRAAKDGAKVVLAAKTAEPHPKLPGTIYTAADEIEAAGQAAQQSGISSTVSGVTNILAQNPDLLTGLFGA